MNHEACIDAGHRIVCVYVDWDNRKATFNFEKFLSGIADILAYSYIVWRDRHAIELRRGGGGVR